MLPTMDMSLDDDDDSDEEGRRRRRRRRRRKRKSGVPTVSLTVTFFLPGLGRETRQPKMK
jgi:hypothetical protein